MKLILWLNLEHLKQYLKPKLIFWRCIDIMVTDKISLPSHYKIQNLILSCIADYKSTMNFIVQAILTEECRKIIDSLFIQEANSQKYRLTLLKKHSQTVTPMKIKVSLTDMALLSELHKHIEPALQQLNLSTDGIRYFASSVIKTKTYHLLRRKNQI